MQEVPRPRRLIRSWAEGAPRAFGLNHRTFDQLTVQRMFQLRPLTEGEQEALDNAPDSHRRTLDGWCATAALRGHVVVYDLEGVGLRTVDPADLGAIGWVS